MKAKRYNFHSFSAVERKLTDSWKKHNLSADYDHPEFGILPDDAPCENCVEVLSRRQADERYFVDVEDETVFYQQKAMGELHAQENGSWITIDHRLKPIAEGVYESGFTSEQAGFLTGSQRSYIRTSSGEVYFNNWHLLTVSEGIETDHGTADWSHVTVGEDGMYITEVFPGIDAQMIVFRGAIKTNFILKENRFGEYDELVFRDRFDTPLAPSVGFSDENTNGIGELTIFSGSTDVLRMNEAVLFAKDGPKELLRSGAYRVHGNEVDVVVPFDWISANIGSYNLVVDPLVTGTNTLAQASITGSMYNGSCNFTNSCNYNLVVQRPANATVTDITWSFSYTATGACWLMDGATRFAAGSCVSPATAGYYWYCNQIGGGTCNGNNISIFSDLSSCMPAPGCTAQNVTFTLQFFRACYGNTGCSGTCVGAGSPWTMTITGRTIEYTNSATPFSVSATTICQGQSITATTTGSYGVPGYTYNWSFSPTGIPSVGTGASASITFPTSGSITLYSIVTDACGNQVTSSRVITVTPGPTISVNSPTICAGGSGVLTASGATSYTWSPASGLSATSGTTVTATPATTTTYTITGTTSGCTGTTTATVTVNTNPVITVNSETICAGGSATLTASGGTTYSWSPGAGLSATTGASVTANPTTTTTYTVTGTTSGCSGTATSTVTIGPNPTVTVTSPTICAGSSATLTANGATTYTWSPGAGLSSTFGATVTANPTTTTTYTVTGTISGCTGTATSIVTVTPLPVVTVNSETICAGSLATLTASGGTSYSWSPPSGLSATSGATVTANPSTTTTYTVTGTASGCSNTATSVVTVNPIPVITVNSSMICEGFAATLTAAGANSYSWSPPLGLSATTGATVLANPPVTTTYTVSGTTNGCTGSLTSTVSVNPNPVVDVNSPTICAGTSTTLTASGATTYSWSPSGGLSANSGETVTASPSVTTTYTVTGSTPYGCTGSATATVTVIPLPLVTVNSVTICAGTSAPLTASGATNYSWSPPTGLSATTGSNVIANPAATTTYTVTGTTSGCSSQSSGTVTVTPLPVVNVSNNGPLCPGDDLNLSSNTIAGAVYSWSGPSGFASGTQNPAITNITAANAGIYTLQITSSGCSASGTTELTLNPGLSTAINPSGPYCVNSSAVTLTAANPGGIWSGTGIVNTSTGLFDPSQATIGNNTITYDLPAGCGGASTATILVLSIPVVDFSADVTTGCAPLETVFTNLSAPQGTSVVWQFGNGSGATTIGSSLAVFNSEGCYDVSLTVTDDQGCTNSLIQEEVVCVLPDPEAAFTVDNVQAPMSNPVFQFLNQSSNSVTHQWFFGDGTFSYDFNPSHGYSEEAGGYNVVLVSANEAGCTDTARLAVTVVEEVIYFVPNSFTPDGNEDNNIFLPVMTSGFDPYHYRLTLYNRWGETLFESNNAEIGWDGTYAGKAAQEGIYTWTITFKDPDTDKKYEQSGHVLLIR